MSHEQVAAAYDQLAERWLDGRFPGDNGIAFYKRALSFLKERGGAALSVGCGCNTRFNGLLRQHGLKPEGVDISERMVVLARAADPAIPVHHADICDWTVPKQYSFIAAWDSIWHVSLQKQRALMLKLMSALRPGGVLLFTAGGLDGPNEHCDSTMGPSLNYASLGIPDLLGVIHEADCVCKHLEFDQLPENHLVVIAQRKI